MRSLPGAKPSSRHMLLAIARLCWTTRRGRSSREPGERAGAGCRFVASRTASRVPVGGRRRWLADLPGGGSQARTLLAGRRTTLRAHHPVLAARLGRVERLVGHRYEIGSRGRGVGNARDADRRRNRGGVPLRKPFDQASQDFRLGDGVLQRAIGQNDQQLFAAVAAGHVGRLEGADVRRGHSSAADQPNERLSAMAYVKLNGEMVYLWSITKARSWKAMSPRNGTNLRLLLS